MSFLEPVAPPEPLAEPIAGPLAEPVVPQQRETVEVVDHVRSHSMRCYWDFVECRWQCPRD
jgi:hypothetical protein